MVRIGIIGSGFMGRTHAEAYECCDQVREIHLLTLPEMKGQAEAIAAQCPKTRSIETDPDRFFGLGIDAVDICTPTPSHVGFIRRAIAERKAILCEKPLCLDSALGRQLVDEAKVAGLPFMVAQVIRFWPEYIYLKSVVDHGGLGRLRTLSMERYSPLPSWGSWFARMGDSGGALFDLHIHDIDFLRHLLGEPRRLSSLGRKQDGVAYQDIQTTLIFEEGARVSVYGSYDHPAQTPFRMAWRALFEKGGLDYDIWRQPTLKEYDQASAHEVSLNGAPGGYAAECHYFVQCIQENKSPELSSADSAAGTIQLLERIAESADRDGAWIDLNLD